MTSFNITILPFGKEHLEKTFVWIQDKELRRDFLLKKEISKESHIKWYNNYINDRSQNVFAIYYNDFYCGNCGLKNIDYSESKAEYWIYIGEKHMYNKGVATKASYRLLDYAYNVLGMQSLYLHVAKHNFNAIKLYDKLGFEFEKKWQDEIYYDNKPICLLRMIK